MSKKYNCLIRLLSYKLFLKKKNPNQCVSVCVSDKFLIVSCATLIIDTQSKNICLILGCTYLPLAEYKYLSMKVPSLAHRVLHLVNRSLCVLLVKTKIAESIKKRKKANKQTKLQCSRILDPWHCGSLTLLLLSWRIITRRNILRNHFKALR